MRSVRVEWEGPFPIDEVLKLNDQSDDSDDYGLYQIYGRHIIFGANSLLYIGKAEGLTFSQRFSQHCSEWLLEEEDVSIRVGRIASEDYAYDPPDWSDWGKVLRDAEALTIYWHSPPYNSQNINDYNGQRLKVINKGKRGALVEEYISDERRSQVEDN